MTKKLDKPLYVPLTAEQLALLEPMFAAIHLSNLKEEPVAIAAQIYGDGMYVRLMRGKRCTALAKALGGDVNKTNISAKQRVESQ